MILNTMNVIRSLQFLNFRSLRLFSTSARTEFLFAKQNEKMNNFVTVRNKLRLRMKDPSAYKKSLTQVSDLRNNSIIFIDDIRSMLALAETDEDLEILKNILLKFSSQKNVVPHNAFIFGPEIMRLFHFLDRPTEALSLVQNPNLVPFFQYYSSITVLVDLLFKNNLYEQIINICDCYEKGLGSKLILFTSEYYFAACYLLNTKATLEKAKAAWYSVLECKELPTLRTKLLFSKILLNHGICPIELVSLHYGSFHSLRENIQYMILAKAQRFIDIFRLIRNILDSEDADKFMITEETLCFIEKEVQNSSESDIVKFCTIKEELKKKNCIILVPLDTFLLGNMKMTKDGDKKDI